MSLLRWPGAKSRLLSQIRSHLDVYLSDATEFHDVFLGGGSVLVDVAMRHTGVRLFGNDRDPGVAALWGVVAGPDHARLRELVLATVPTLSLREEWKARAPQSDLEAAFQVLLLNRTSFSGNLTGGRIGGDDIAARWNPVRLCREINRLHALLYGRFEVHCEDATDYLNRLVLRTDAVVYLDAPYYSVGNQLYRVGMTPEEHRALAKRVRDLTCWVASYDDVPEVHDLYEWAVRRPVATTYTTARARGAREWRQELVIVPNGHPVIAKRPAADDGLVVGFGAHASGLRRSSSQDCRREGRVSV